MNNIVLNRETKPRRLVMAPMNLITGFSLDPQGVLKTENDEPKERDSGKDRM